MIEDACQAHTTTWKGKRLGTLGTAGCFSFQESKVLPGGELGAMVSNDPELIKKAYTWRNFGLSLDTRHETIVVRGAKYRTSDFAPAIAMAQITRYQKVHAIQEENAGLSQAATKKDTGNLSAGAISGNGAADLLSLWHALRSGAV